MITAEKKGIGDTFGIRGTFGLSSKPGPLGLNPVQWYDASDTSTITLNGSNVEQWDDKSGNDLHLVQSVAAARPTYNASNTSVDFDGIDDFMVTPYKTALDLTDNATFVVVLENERDVAVEYFYSRGNLAFNLYKTGNFSRMGIPGQGDIQWFGNPASNGLEIMTFIKNGTFLQGRLNGFVQPTFTFNRTGGNIGNPCWIGKSGGATAPWQGKLKELLVYNRQLTDNEIKSLEYYLALKHNVFPFALNDNIKLWVNPQDETTVTLNGSDVSSIKDSSRNGNDLTQSTPTNQPLYSISGLNGLNVIDFDGINNWLQGAAYNFFGQPYSIFIVGSSTSGPQCFLGWDFSGLHGILLQSEISPNRIRYLHRYPYSSVPGTGDDLFANYDHNTNQVLMFQKNDTTMNTFINGTLAGTRGASGSYFPNAGTGYALGRLGNNPSLASRYLNGPIAEVLIVTGELSDSQRQKIENYLFTKWAIDLIDQQQLQVFGALTSVDNWQSYKPSITGTQKRFDIYFPVASPSLTLRFRSGGITGPILQTIPATVYNSGWQQITTNFPVIAESTYVVQFQSATANNVGFGLGNPYSRGRLGSPSSGDLTFKSYVTI